MQKNWKPSRAGSVLVHIAYKEKDGGAFDARCVLYVVFEGAGGGDT